MSSPHSNWSLPVPSLNQAYIKVSALEAGFIALPDAMFITPTSPIRGPDHITNAPSLSFLLTHEKNGQRMLFDLGLRKNHSEAPENGGYPPIVKSWIEKVYNLSVPRDVRDSIRKGNDGTDLLISHILVSHIHFDHIGDPSLFPSPQTEFLIGGAAEPLLAPDKTYPMDPNSQYSQAFPKDRTRYLHVDAGWHPIGPFPKALDFYGDGSLYIVDSPGHVEGHVNVLVRTSKGPSGDNWIFLAGDSAHFKELITGEASVSFNVTSGVFVCAHAGKDQANVHIARIRELLSWNESGKGKVKVILAHDIDFWNEESEKVKVRGEGKAGIWPGVIEL